MKELIRLVRDRLEPVGMAGNTTLILLVCILQETSKPYDLK